MPDVNIKFENEPQPPEEETLKQEKKTILEEQQGAEQQAQQPQQEQGVETGSLASIIVMNWNKIAVDKGYEPVSDRELEYLKEHSQRLEAKYSGKLAVLKSPELEFAIALIHVFAPKIYDHYAKSKQLQPQSSGANGPNA